MDGINTDKLFEEMEVEFEDMKDQESSNEEVQSNTECLIGLSNTDHADLYILRKSVRWIDVLSNKLLLYNA